MKGLGHIGYIDLGEVQSYDKETSNTILGNLDIIDSKRDVLCKAFEYCPYNANVYYKAAEYGLLDEETFNTAKYLHQENCLVQILQEGCISSFTNKEYKRVQQSVTLLSRVRHEPLEVVSKPIFSEIVARVLGEYDTLKKAFGDKNILGKWISQNISSDKEELTNNTKEDNTLRINNKIYSIISYDAYKCLIEVHALNPVLIYNGTSVNPEDINSVNKMFCIMMGFAVEGFIEEIKETRKQYKEKREKYNYEIQSISNEIALLQNKKRTLSVFQ